MAPWRKPTPQDCQCQISLDGALTVTFIAPETTGIVYLLSAAILTNGEHTNHRYPEIRIRPTTTYYQVCGNVSYDVPYHYL